MPFIEISINTKADEAELVADGLQSLDALSVSLVDAKDNALFQLEPNDTPLWNDVKVRALFDDSISPRGIISELKKWLNRKDPINYRIKKIADEDWVRLTQQHFQPQCYANTLWICPSWHEQPLSGNIVRIDPGLAFGTGTHPTTSLCLEWLAQNPPTHKTVIDYGCGSGILALAAITLGAKQVYATDHDEQALSATHNNAQLNDHINAKNLTVCYPNALPHIKADLITANILANPLIELAPTLAELIKPGGHIILSGLLEHEIQVVAKAYQVGFTLLSTDTKEQWTRLVLHKNV